MILIHFIILCGSIIQTKQQSEIVASPDTEVWNSDEPAKKCQLDEDDAICSSDGRRCFRGECLDPGKLLVNAETGECVLSSDPCSSEGLPKMGTCPSPSSPMDRFISFKDDGKSLDRLLGMPYFSENENGEMKIKYKCLGFRTHGNMSNVLRFFECSSFPGYYDHYPPILDIDSIISLDWGRRDFTKDTRIEEFNIGTSRIDFLLLFQNGSEVLLRNTSMEYLNDIGGLWNWETPLPTHNINCKNTDKDDENYGEKCTTDLALLVDFVPIEMNCIYCQYETVAKMNVSLKSLYGMALDPGIIISWNRGDISNLTEIPSNCQRQENINAGWFHTEYKCSLGYILESNRNAPAPIATFTFGQIKKQIPGGEVKVVPTTSSQLRPHLDSKSMPLPGKPLSVVKTLCSGFTGEVREILEKAVDEMKKNETDGSSNNFSAGIRTIFSNDSGHFVLGLVAGIFLSSTVFAVVIWATNFTLKDGQRK